MKRRILFVDDDPAILEGLQNLLRKQRDVWEMRFAPSGAAALEVLAASTFDVLVTDMRMPGMDGGALLEQVKEKHPVVARIVLSGHADREAVMRTLPLAHQFLSKPCDPGVLCAVIDRTCNLQASLFDAGTREAVGKVGRLPSADKTYWDLTKAVQQPDVSTADLARIVEQDPAMTAKVLQLVNSAYFALPREVTSIQQAVFFLGVELLKGLVLSAHVFGLMHGRSIPGFSLADLQRHSLQTARLARRFLKSAEAADAAFTAAIVHDVGQIILAQAFPDELGQILSAARATGLPPHEVERQQLGVSHAEVGAYLLGVWGLPFPIVEAVAFHHVPGRIVDGDRDVLAAVHAADVLVDETLSTGSAAKAPALDMDFLESAGWSAEVPRWRETAREMMAADGAGARRTSI